MPPRLAVIALGSVLEGDDGAGPALLAHLEADWQLAPHTIALDLGTPGPYLAEYLRGFEAVLVLDAVRAPLPAGSVVVESDPRKLRSAPARLAPHDPNLGEALARLDLAGEAPRETVVVGIVPARVELGTELSPEVRAALGAAVEAAVGELRRLGAAPTPRAEPAPPALWWARGETPTGRDPAGA